MRRAISLLAGTTLAAAAVCGCASTVYEGKYAWDLGWREAKVVRLGAASELGGRHTSDCRYRAPQAADRYAVVSYSDVGRQRRAVVPIAANQSFGSGDAVYANLRECSASTLVPRPRHG